MGKTELKGSVVAIVTPFKDDGSIDYDTFEKLIEFHIQNSTHWILVAGTTGESATLSHQEHKDLIKFAVEKAAGRISIMAGAGSNSTREAVELTEYAEKVGADAVLSITPYYNKPTQEGLFRHFREVAKATSLPVIVYNVPSRTGINLEPSTCARLAEIENIKGIKEASGSLKQITRIIELTGDRWALFSGDDFTAFPTMAVGGVGVISVVANIAPKDVAGMVEAALAGNWEKARQLHYKIQPLCRAMFLETNPIPVKTALGMMGMIRPNLRLPLCEMSPENKTKLENILKEYGLL